MMLFSRAHKKLAIDHEDEFKHCMATYNIEDGPQTFENIVLAISFYESRYNFQLVIQKSTSDSYPQYRCKQDEGCPFYVSFGRKRSTGLLEMKNYHYIHSGTEVVDKAKGGQKWKRRRKGLFQDSYVLASSTHKSTPKSVDLQITVENYKGEHLDYNKAYWKVEEVNKVKTKVAVKSFELLIPFLQEW